MHDGLRRYHTQRTLYCKAIPRWRWRSWDSSTSTSSWCSPGRRAMGRRCSCGYQSDFDLKLVRRLEFGSGAVAMAGMSREGSHRSEAGRSVLPAWIACGSLRGLFLREASAPEDVRHAVVPFVAGILVQRTLGRDHRNFRAPWPGPRVGIVNRKLVEDPVGAHAREAFDDMQGGTRSLERGPVGEIRRVDDERVALPAAARVAGPLPDVFRDVRPPVGRDQTRRGCQLPDHQDVARRLDDLQHVVVGRRQHGWTFVRPA